MKKDILLFNLSASKELTKRVANLLDIKQAKSETIRFADGEIMSRAVDSVEGKNVYVIQSTSNPAPERILEALIFVDSVKRAGAKTINLIMPYYGYARQDRIGKFQEPLSSSLLASLIETSGVDSLFLLDVHSERIKSFFKIPVYEMSLIPTFAMYLKIELKDVNNEDIVIVSPDEGGIIRAQKLLDSFKGASLAYIKKDRPSIDRATFISLHGDVKDKTCIIIDDIIDTGGTILSASQGLLDHGANSVYVVATHAVFSDDSRLQIEKSSIKKIYVGDSIEEVKADKKICVVSCDLTIACWIKKIA